MYHGFKRGSRYESCELECEFFACAFAASAAVMSVTPLANAVPVADGNGLLDSGWLAPDATKQDLLVSGTNIKTINSTSLLGSGDIVIPTPP